MKYLTRSKLHLRDEQSVTQKKVFCPRHSVVDGTSNGIAANFRSFHRCVSIRTFDLHFLCRFVRGFCFAGRKSKITWQAGLPRTNSLDNNIKKKYEFPVRFFPEKLTCLKRKEDTVVRKGREGGARGQLRGRALMEIFWNSITRAGARINGESRSTRDAIWFITIIFRISVDHGKRSIVSCHVAPRLFSVPLSRTQIRDLDLFPFFLALFFLV